jgi:pimeloyl-ACP methyl ester carboxylesterase
METVTSKDGTRIAYDKTGQGPAVILVGGAMSVRTFEGMVELAGLLAPHFTAINYDRRGRGDSTDTPPYAVAREVEDLAALIEAAGGSAHVWGWSSGAALALEAAASGLHITKLALYEPPYMVDAEGPHPPADHQAQLKAMIAAGRRDDAVRFFMRDMVNVPPLMVFVMRLMPFWKQLRAVAHTLPYDAAVLGDFSLPAERIASVRIPTLAMAGDKTDPRLLHAAQAVADCLPNGQLRRLAGQSHNVSMKVLAPVLVEFFAD